MNFATDAVTTFALLLAFCILHSILASSKVKKAFQNKFGNRIAFYRLTYNILSVVSFGIIYLSLPKIDLQLYAFSNPFYTIALTLQLISIAGIIWCGQYFSMSEFLGWSQIKRYLRGNYDSNDTDEKSELRIEGPYKYSRHPVYFFSIMFLIMRPVMGLTYLIIVVIFTAYFYIGSIFEEKRLVEKFGEAYLKYQKAVPRIFPIKIFRT